MADNDPTWRERASEFVIRRLVNAKERASRLMRPGSVLVLVLVTITAAAAVLKEIEIPNAAFWRTRGPATVSLGVIAALSYVGYCCVVIGFNRLLKSSNENTRLLATCRDVAALVVKETGIPPARVGVHVWTIRGIRPFRRLERRATHVPVDRTKTNITWRKGKGVLGQCWLRDDWILADLSRMANAATKREFDAIPRADRFLFTWSEARATRHYKAILAWPLHGGPPNARRVVGVMSVDVQDDDGVGLLDEAWTAHRPDFDAHVAVAEAILPRS